jgi:mono/diheme cytochrome c family protein
MRTLAAVMMAAVAVAAAAQESKVQLKEGPGRDKANACIACHSLDYIEMNSRFMDKTGWTASVNKMINVYGAPIDKADAEAIAEYLAQNYGVSK